LIAIKTTHEHGNTTPAAEAMARRLLAAGFPAGDVVVLGPATGNHNLVARLRGTGARRPILLLAHLDVVEARREDWSVDPFALTEQDGFFYGRGTLDIKDMAALFVTTLVRLKREGYVPDRDIILALTAGEESGGDYNGVQWLLQNHRDLIDAVYCINGDSGDPLKRAGRPFARGVQASEKVYLSLALTARNPGGHSSLPPPSGQNAIYDLAAALTRVAGYRFPVRLNDITRAYFTRVAATLPPAVATDVRGVLQTPPDAAAAARLSAASPFFNAQLRTTCVATRVEAGHADNALPQTARRTPRRRRGGHAPRCRERLHRGDGQRLGGSLAALTARAGGDGGSGARDGRDVARRARGPQHGDRRDRRPFFAQRGDAGVRRVGRVPRRGRHPRPWPRRADRRARVLRGGGVHVSLRKGHQP
jgi:acetylornithine deacetylase/succinyl-diaminopimelate desuccinylase-like protein